MVGNHPQIAELFRWVKYCNFLRKDGRHRNSWPCPLENHRLNVGVRSVFAASEVWDYKEWWTEGVGWWSLSEMLFCGFFFLNHRFLENLSQRLGVTLQLSVIPETWQWKIPDLYIISPLKASFIGTFPVSHVGFFLIEDWKINSLTICPILPDHLIISARYRYLITWPNSYVDSIDAQKKVANSRK